MIQVFLVEAPLDDRAPEPLIATLEASLQQMQVMHPALRGAVLEHSDGVLRMRLRTVGTDRWRTLRAARTVATTMLKRVKISPPRATMTLVETEPGAESLTKEQGRNHAGGRGSRVRRWDHIPWWNGD